MNLQPATCFCNRQSFTNGKHLMTPFNTQIWKHTGKTDFRLHLARKTIDLLKENFGFVYLFYKHVFSSIGKVF